MAAITLDYLVLHGSVRLDVLAVEALGTSPVNAQAPGTRNSMRHPLPAGGPAEPTGAFDPAADYPAAGRTPVAVRARYSWRKRAC
jgi:hypothetical protein